MKVPDLSFETLGARLILCALLPQGIEFRLSLLQRGLSDVHLLGKSASFLSHLVLLGLVTLERMLQIDLGTLHLVQSRSLVPDLAARHNNHAVPIGELRLQGFAVVARVAYRLFKRINSPIWSGGCRPDNILALLLANLKLVDGQCD